MFDNVAFEVVIGLVFVYLLYSLLITIVGEIISTACGIRQRLLRIAIERMFNDGYYAKIERVKKSYSNFLNDKWLSIKGWARKVLLYEPDEFKTSFAGKFYEYPAIKYLGRIEDDHKSLFTSTKPAYITPQYFADTVINFLRDKGSGATDMERVGFCLKFNTYHIEPKTLKQFRNLFENAANNKDAYRQNLMNWFNETMDRNIGWYKRKMRFILFWLGVIIAISFNVDTIRIAKILANDKEARGQLVSMGVALSKDSARYQDFVSGNGDTVHSKAILDSGYSHITKDINAANLVLGLGWQFDTLRKHADYELKDCDVRFAKLVSKIDIFNKTKDSIKIISDNIGRNLDTIETENDSIQLFASDTLFKAQQIALADKDKEQLKNDLKEAQKHITEIQKRILFHRYENKKYVLINKNNIDLNNKRTSEINNLTKQRFININKFFLTKKGDTIKISGTRDYKSGEKFCYFLSAIFCQYGWLGFLITALAVCLGAPFWFGVLSKLVSIRGVGVNPNEKKEEDKTNNQKANSTLNKEDVFLKQEEEKLKNQPRYLLKKCKAELLNIDGVVLIKDISKFSNWKLEILSTKAITTTIVQNKIDAIVESKIEIVFDILITDQQPKHFTEPGEFIPLKGISNKSKFFGFGALGCIVFNNMTKQKNFITCWHVLKGDKQFDNKFSDSDEIIDFNTDTVIGQRSAGGINEELDIGIAILKNNPTYTDNNFLKLGKLTRGELTPDDADNNLPIVFFDNISGNLIKGNIVNRGCAVKVFCLDGNFRNFTDVIAISKSTGSNDTISQGGNSGSIIIHQSNKENKVLAMIIAGDKNFTYAIEMSKIFSHFEELEII